MLTIDTQAIAELTGYTRKHVTDRLTKRPDFPKPVIAISRKNTKWSKADVLAWIERVSQAA